MLEGELTTSSAMRISYDPILLTWVLIRGMKCPLQCYANFSWEFDAFRSRHNLSRTQVVYQ